MKIRAADATGYALDWAVAKARGLDPVFTASWCAVRPHPDDGDSRRVCVLNQTQALTFFERYEPSTNWWKGGPIIEILIDEGFAHQKADWGLGIKFWRLRDGDRLENQYGPTTLIAAMRCFVASRLGDEIEIPDELVVV